MRPWSRRELAGAEPAGAVIAMLVLLGWGPVTAQPTLYAAADVNAAFSFLELDLHEDTTLQGRLVGDPGRHGAAAYAFEAPFELGHRTIRLAARLDPGLPGAGLQEGSRRDEGATPSDGRLLTVVAQVADGEARLPAHGRTQVVLEDELAGRRIEIAFQAIGTTVEATARSTDGSLARSRTAPLFYAEPWRGLELAGDAAGRLTRKVRHGLDPRHDRRAADGGARRDHRTTQIRTLTRELVSVLHVQQRGMGGAHATRVLASETFVGDGENWRRASVCEALRALRWPCEEAVLRARVIDALRAKDAGKVVDGEVTAEAPLLLDVVTVEAAGVAAHFAPGRVGPHRQGAFEVRVPFERVRR